MLPVKLLPSSETIDRRQPMDEYMQSLRDVSPESGGVSPKNDTAAPRDRVEWNFGAYAKSAREMPRDEYIPSSERKAYESAKREPTSSFPKEGTFTPCDPFGKELEIVPTEARPWEKSMEEFMHPLEAESCKICAERKYVDRSDDMSVTFQTPTHVAPQQARTAVKQHEQQHVREHQRQAEDKNLKVVSQAVTIKHAICPCCGQTYVKGGVTQTITANKGYEIYKKLHGDTQSDTGKCH